MPPSIGLLADACWIISSRRSAQRGIVGHVGRFGGWRLYLRNRGRALTHVWLRRK